ncbi:MAG: flagellar filament capping protein FliD [Bacillota bacterium]
MSRLNIAGLISGLDTKSIVEQLMALERRPLYLAQQRQTRLEEVNSAWKDINTRLSTLQTKAQKLSDPSTFDARKAAVSDSAILQASATSEAETGTYTIEVSGLATKHTVAGNVLASATESLGLSGNPLVNGQEVAIEATDSLSAIKDKINATAGIGVKAAIVETAPGQHRLVITAEKTGSSQAIVFDENGGTVWNDLGILIGGAIKDEIQAATNSVFTVNGLTIEREGNVISDVIGGVTLNLLKAPNSGTLSVTVAVEQDLDVAVNAVKDMVSQFNSVIAFISEKSGYDPKTRITGPLAADSSAKRIVTELRQKITDFVTGFSGELGTLADVGLTTGAFGTADYGRLTLDEAKLREQLTKDLDGVKSAFTGESGIGQKLVDYVEGYTNSVSGIISEKSKSHERQIKGIEDRIAEMERRLEQREARLQDEFTRLEKAMGQFQSQSNWLSQQLTSLTGFSE